MDFLDDDAATNIWVAASNGDVDAVKNIMATAGTAVNAQDETGYAPLHAAASYSQVEMLEFLLSMGATVDLLDFDGDTPLLVCEEPDCYNKLIAAGANPKARNTANQGILEKVMEDENEVMLKFLVENGLLDDPDVKYTPGMFDFAFANENDEEDMIEEGDEDESDDDSTDAEA